VFVVISVSLLFNTFLIALKVICSLSRRNLLHESFVLKERSLTTGLRSSCYEAVESVGFRYPVIGVRVLFVEVQCISHIRLCDYHSPLFFSPPSAITFVVMNDIDNLLV
jgi:hypothetical protein